MRKFESSQKDESRAQFVDSSKAYRKRRAFYCLIVLTTTYYFKNCFIMEWNYNLVLWFEPVDYYVYCLFMFLQCICSNAWILFFTSRN